MELSFINDYWTRYEYLAKTAFSLCHPLFPRRGKRTSDDDETYRVSLVSCFSTILRKFTNFYFFLKVYAPFLHWYSSFWFIRCRSYKKFLIYILPLLDPRKWFKILFYVFWWHNRCHYCALILGPLPLQNVWAIVWSREIVRIYADFAISKLYRNRLPNYVPFLCTIRNILRRLRVRRASPSERRTTKRSIRGRPLKLDWNSVRKCHLEQQLVCKICGNLHWIHAKI